MNDGLAVDRFTEILDELKDLHNKKNLDYGGVGDPYANVRGSEAWGIPGWLGAMVRANDKVKRLQSFAANGRLANEGVEDAFKDLAVYAIISLVLYEEMVAKAAIELGQRAGETRALIDATLTNMFMSKPPESNYVERRGIGGGVPDGTGDCRDGLVYAEGRSGHAQGV